MQRWLLALSLEGPCQRFFSSPSIRFCGERTPARTVKVLLPTSASEYRRGREKYDEDEARLRLYDTCFFKSASKFNASIGFN